MAARLQLALDFVNLQQALRVAREAVEGGVELLEAGTPLVKCEGLEAVRALRREFPKQSIVADLKTMDAGRMEMEAAAKAGATIATVLGVASDATIRECVEAGRNYGVQIQADLIGVPDPAARARRLEELGASIVGVHCPIDEQMAGRDPFERLRQVREAVSVTLAVAGGINSETAADAVAAGADIVVVGGAIAKAEDARAAAAAIRRAMVEGVRIETALFKRGGSEERVRELLRQVSTPNLSDALHRSGELPGLLPISPGFHLAGPAVTVRTYPGDWAKPVEAIDHCREGDVIVIDAGGVPPAVWGELATESCLQRKVAGVVIHGAIRDVDSIRRLQFPAFARHITPTAWEPKGFGEINQPIRIENVEVAPGDWIVGDDSGVVRVPRSRAVEVANRAMDVLERENRLRTEIRGARTLSEITELLRWERK